MKKMNHLIAVSASLLLIGCGGGSSSSKNDKNTSTSTTEKEQPKTEETTTPKENTTKLVNADFIKGIYNISSNSDTAYLVISEDGTLTTYKHKDSNCYEKNPTDINNKINGKKITHDAANKAFTLASTLYWIYGEKNKIEKVYVGGLTAGGKLSLNGLRIASSKHLTTNVTVEEFNQSVCK